MVKRRRKKMHRHKYRKRLRREREMKWMVKLCSHEVNHHQQYTFISEALQLS
jgi:hypothetical protein